MLGSLRTAERADVIFSTVDTVGIPLILLKRIGLVRRPLVYVRSGCRNGSCSSGQSRCGAVPKRTAQSRRRSWPTASTKLRCCELAWARRTRVVFVPFGVDVGAFRPDEAEPEPT